MSTPSLTPSPPPAGDPLTVPDRPAAKAGLLLLVLLMLGLLLWQMSQELRQQERFEHERAAVGGWFFWRMSNDALNGWGPRAARASCSRTSKVGMSKNAMG